MLSNELSLSGIYLDERSEGEGRAPEGEGRAPEGEGRAPESPKERENIFVKPQTPTPTLPNVILGLLSLLVDNHTLQVCASTSKTFKNIVDKEKVKRIKEMERKRISYVVERSVEIYTRRSTINLNTNAQKLVDALGEKFWKIMYSLGRREKNLYLIEIGKLNKEHEHVAMTFFNEFVNNKEQFRVVFRTAMFLYH